MADQDDDDGSSIDSPMNVRHLLAACGATLAIALTVSLVTILVTNTALSSRNDREASAAKALALTDCDAANTSRAGIRAIQRDQEHQQESPQAQRLIRLLFPDPSARAQVRALTKVQSAKERRVRFALFPLRDCPRSVRANRRIYVKDELEDRFVVATRDAALREEPLPIIRDGRVVAR